MATPDLSAIKVAVQSLMKQNDKFGSFKEAKKKLDKKYPRKENGDNAIIYRNKEGKICASAESSNHFCNSIIYDFGKDVVKDYPFDSAIVCKAESKSSDYMNYISGSDYNGLIFQIYDSHRNGKIDNDDTIIISSSYINNNFSKEMTVGEILGFTKKEKTKPKENDEEKPVVITPPEPKTKKPVQKETKPNVQPKIQKTEPKQAKPQEKQPPKISNNQPKKPNVIHNNTGINNSFNNNSGVIIIK